MTKQQNKNGIINQYAYFVKNGYKCSFFNLNCGMGLNTCTNHYTTDVVKQVFKYIHCSNYKLS